MSYSFTVTADTKAEAKAKVAAEFDNVVTGQPVHAADRDAVVACGQAFIDALAAPADGYEIYVYVFGSLGWVDGPSAPLITSANTSVSVAIRVKSSA